jgi:hypothetical protein
LPGRNESKPKQRRCEAEAALKSKAIPKMRLNMRFFRVICGICNHGLTHCLDGLVTMVRRRLMDMRGAFAWVIAVAVLTGAGFVGRAAALEAPFALRSPDPKASAKECSAAPEPVRTFAPVSKYGQAGAARDQVDADADAAFEAAMKPIRAYSREVVKAANDYHRTGRVSAAACALTHLAVWAEADALGSPGSHTAWFKLATTLSGLSLAYVQIKPATAGQAGEHRKVEAWLNRRGHDVARYFATLQTPRSSRNNHRAWLHPATRPCSARRSKAFALRPARRPRPGHCPWRSSAARKRSSIISMPWLP